MKHFVRFLTSTSSVQVIKNTLILGVYNLVVSFPIPIILAVAINEIQAKFFKKTVQMVTYAPYFISIVVLVGMLFSMTDLRTGIFNILLGFNNLFSSILIRFYYLVNKLISSLTNLVINFLCKGINIHVFTNRIDQFF